MEVPIPKPKPQETYVQQKLIVISLRRKLFLEKQAVVKDELADGWRIKDIQLGVGEKGINGFISILLEREVYATTETLSQTSHIYFPAGCDTDTNSFDPHDLGDEQDYTLEDGEPIDHDQPYTFNDDGPDDAAATLDELDEFEEKDDDEEVGC